MCGDLRRYLSLAQPDIVIARSAKTPRFNNYQFVCTVDAPAATIGTWFILHFYLASAEF